MTSIKKKDGKALRIKHSLKQISNFNFKVDKFVVIVKWLTKIWFPDLDLASITSQVELYKKWYHTKGPEWTIKRIKTLRLALSRNLAGQPLSKQPYMSYRGRWPKSFINTKLLDDGNINYIRFTYTLLEFSKLIDWWPKPSYDSITDFPTSSPVLKGEELANIYKEINNFCIDGEWKEFHYSVKAGPIGRAVSSSIEEIKHIDDDLFQNISLFGGESLKKSMINCKTIMANVPSSDLKGKYFREIHNNETLRKISHIQAPEGKLRPIAIFDYWSQTSLKWFHDRLFQSLRRFSQDCTFNHNHAKFSDENYCYDLTAATDRFPMKLQVEFLSELIGKDKAFAWEAIMTSSEFRTPEGDLINYNTGQPMGAYSSWAMFAICHHLIVQYCAKIEGLSLPFKQYYLLGDDIVIQNRKVAKRYEEVLQDLGVGISREKTIESNDFMEFAKRHWYKGNEVTPFHVCAVVKTYKSYIDLYSYITSMPRQGWELPYSRRCELIKRLLVSLGMPRAYATRQARNIYSLELLTEMINTYPRNPQLAMEIGELAKFNFSCNHRLTVAQEFILEVTASLKLQVIQESLIDGVKGINKVSNNLIRVLSPHFAIQQSDLDDVPVIAVLIKRSQELLRETQTTAGLAQAGFINLARMEFSLLPDSVRVISQKPKKERSSPARALINKIFVFLKQDTVLISQELND
jgi:hypothetical protein